MVKGSFIKMISDFNSLQMGAGAEVPGQSRSARRTPVRPMPGIYLVGRLKR
jgi:hypothetical protein